MKELERLYTSIGGHFITPLTEIQKKLERVKAYVFDWDGVFNTGQKSSSGGSDFSEVDSMGTNLLRFSYFLKHGRMPITAILSGEKNDTAFFFSEREGFNYSFHKVAHKLEALNFLCEKENIKPDEIAYFFDDVLDVPLAEVCGVRIMVHQKINPLFVEYCKKNNLVDYLTASQGGHFAVREATELLIGLNCNYDDVIKGRKNNTPVYQEYIEKRKVVKPQLLSLIDGVIQPFDPRQK